MNSLLIKGVMGSSLALALLAAGAAQAGTLTGVTFALANNAPSAVTTATFQFKTETALAPGTFHNAPYLELPGFSLNTDAACTGVTMTVDGVPRVPNFCAISVGSAIGVQTNAGISAGAIVVVSIPVTNPATIGLKTTSFFRTSATPGNAVIDAPAAQPSVTIVAAVPTLSEWAMILFGLLLAGGAALYIQRRQMAV